MARINIDDGIESRPEYRKLHKLLGYDDDKALGMLVRFWRLAQDYWGEHKLVPLEEIENWEFQPIIDSRWGIVKPEGVYAIGSEDRFAWYRQRCDAGRKRAGESRNEKGQFKAEPSEPPAELNEAVSESIGPPADHQPLSLVLSLSPSLVKKEESIGETAIAVCPDSKLPEISKKKKSNPEMGRFIGVYVKAFQEKYPAKEGGPPPRPDLRGKTQGQIKRYLDEIPIDRACDLIQTYCQMDEPWFKTKCHDFGTFLENQNKVSLALDRGEDTSQPGSHIDWSKFT